PLQIAGGTGNREVLEGHAGGEAPELEVPVGEAALSGCVVEVRRVDGGREAGERLPRAKTPVLGPKSDVVRRREQGDDADVIVSRAIDALLVRGAIVGPVILIGPAGVVGVTATDTNRQVVLHDREGGSARDLIVGGSSPLGGSQLSLADELEIFQIGVAGVENEDATGGSLPIECALGTAQHLDLFDVNKSHRRCDTEIGNDEGNIIEVVTDR